MRGFSVLAAEVASAFDVPVSHVFSERRTARIADARQLLYLMARDLLGWSYGRIGRHINRDHSTVIHGAQKASRRVYESPEEFERMKSILRSYTARMCAR